MRNLFPTQVRSFDNVIVLTLVLLLFGTGCKGPSQSTKAVVYIDTARMGLPQGLGPSPPLTPFQLVESLSEFPSPLRSRIGPKMVDPGEPFNPGDVDIPGISDRRLIFGGKYKTYYLVHYEVGGVGHEFIIALFDVRGEQADPLWAHAGIQFSSAAEFSKVIERRELKNEAGYIFKP